MDRVRWILAASAAALALILATAAPAFSKDEEKPATEASIQDALEKRRVTLSFPEVPLGDVINFLRDVTGVNFVLDPGVDPDTSSWLRVKDVTLKEALPLMLGATGEDLEYEIWRGAIYIAKKGAAAPAYDPPLAPADRAKLDAKPVVWNFPETPIGDVAAFISHSGSGVRFSVAEGVERPVTLRLKGIVLSDALAILCRTHGLALERDAGGSYVFKAR